MRQPVCPNKQPAEGGCLIITSPLFSHPGFTFHLTTNTGPRLWLCPLSLLEFRDVSGASKATIHMLFSTWRGQHSTRQRPGRGETKTQWVFVTFSPLKRLKLMPSTAWCIVWWRRLSTPEASCFSHACHLPFPTVRRWKIPVLREGCGRAQITGKTWIIEASVKRLQISAKNVNQCTFAWTPLMWKYSRGTWQDYISNGAWGTLIDEGISPLTAT